MALEVEEAYSQILLAERGSVAELTEGSEIIVVLVKASVASEMNVRVEDDSARARDEAIELMGKNEGMGYARVVGPNAEVCQNK